MFKNKNNFYFIEDYGGENFSEKYSPTLGSGVGGFERNIQKQTNEVNLTKK